MTVLDLIEQLKRIPPDAKIKITYDSTFLRKDGNVSHYIMHNDRKVTIEITKD